MLQPLGEWRRIRVTPTSPSASGFVPHILKLDADAAAAFCQSVVVGEELQLMLKAWGSCWRCQVIGEEVTRVWTSWRQRWCSSSLSRMVQPQWRWRSVGASCGVAEDAVRRFLDSMGSWRIVSAAVRRFIDVELKIDSCWRRWGCWTLARELEGLVTLSWLCGHVLKVLLKPVTSWWRPRDVTCGN